MEYADFLKTIPEGLGVTEKTLRLWFVIYQWIVENGYADSADSPEFLQHVNAFRKCSTQTVATHLRRMSDAKLIKRNVLRRKLPAEAKEALSIGSLLFAPGPESIPTTFVRYCLPEQTCPTEFKSFDAAVTAIDGRLNALREAVPHNSEENGVSMKTVEQQPKGYDVSLEEVDEAARIFVAHTTTAMQEMLAKGLDCGAAVQAVVQMSLRTYADLLGDDEEAIRQTRKFLDEWERDLSEAPASIEH